jgi:hypothetical protein
MSQSPRVEIHVTPLKPVLVALFLGGLAILLGYLTWQDVASPEAFTDALLRAEHRRRIQMIEIFPNRYAYMAVSALMLLCLTGMSAATIAIVATAKGPIMVLDGTRIERILPWAVTEFRIAPGSRVTTVAGGLKVEPPATVVASRGWAARKVGSRAPVVAMNWKFSRMSGEAMDRFLEQYR